MRAPLIVLATLVVLGASAAIGRAQETVETASGRTYQAEILSNDGTSVEIKTTDGATMKLSYESLAPGTQYRMRSLLATPDAQSQLDLAEWCVAKTFYEQAKIHYRAALAADPLMSEKIYAAVVVARKTAANELLARAKSLQAAKKPQEAREILSTLVQELPLEDASKEAAKMLAEETNQRKEQALSRPSTKASSETTPGGASGPVRENGEPFSEGTRTMFEPLVDSYRKLLDATQEGLAKSGSSGIKEYEKALKEGEKIRKAADKLRPKAGTDPEITEALQLVDSKLEEAVVDARVNMAHDYLMRTSYNEAAKVVNEGLAEYPQNSRLQQTRNQVTAAASNNGGGDWIIGGRRG